MKIKTEGKFTCHLIFLWKSNKAYKVIINSFLDRSFPKSEINSKLARFLMNVISSLFVAASHFPIGSCH